MTDAAGQEPAKATGKWHKNLAVIGITIAYMIPLFWLWTETGWPEKFGIRIVAYGKAGLFENWYYSYLLLRRPSLINDFTFGYMWAPILGFAGWLAWVLFRQITRSDANGS